MPFYRRLLCYLSILFITTNCAEKGNQRKTELPSSQQNTYIVPNITAELKEGWLPEKTILSQSQKINLVFLDGSKEKPQQETHVYFFTYQGYLGFLAKCFDNDTSHLVYRKTNRDDPLWVDDNLELNLNQEPNNNENDIRITINPIGTLSDAKGKEQEKWNADIKVKSIITDKMWQVQVLIPLHAITDKTLIKNIKANLARTRYGHANSPAEETAWSATHSLRSNVSAFYQHLQINPLALEEKPLVSKLVDLPEDHNTTLKLTQYLQQQTNNQVVICNPSNEEINLDGALEESSWKYQKSHFLKTQDHRKNLNLQDTIIKTYYNNNTLYIGVVCFDNQMRLLASEQKENNKDFGEDDVIELFLNPYRYSSSPYLHLIINPINAKVLQMGKKILKPNEENPYENLFKNIQTATFKTINYWSLEIAIPLNDFNLKSSLPSEWGFNLTRYRPQKNNLASQSSSWADLLSLDFHKPGRFGTIWLKGKNKIEEEVAKEILAINLPHTESATTEKDYFLDKNFDFLSNILSDEALHSLTSSAFQKVRETLVNNRITKWDEIIKEKTLQQEQTLMRENFIKSLGGFPEKTPLNAKTIKIFSCDEYEIYNVIYESMPKHYVTGNLFVPTNLNNKKAPTVIRVIGHSTPGKNSKNVLEFNDHVVRQGYIVLALDSLGQGERIFVNQGNGSRTPTSNHFAMGAPSVLIGQNLAKYFVWDAIRAVDFLHTVSEVDTKKIIITGESGGGTITSYVAALEPRLAGAASCSAMGSDIYTTGGHDSEQMLANCYEGGFDSLGRIAMIAPRPFAILGEYSNEKNLKTNQEMIIQGKKAYNLLGQDSNLEYYPTKAPHGYGPVHRKIFYSWLAKTFPNGEIFSMQEKPLLFNNIDALHATKTWKVYYTPELQKRLTVQEMNESAFQKIQKQFATYYKANTTESIRQNLTAVLNISPTEIKPLDSTFFDKQQLENNVTLEKSYLKITDEVYIPYLILYQGAQATNRLIIWLNQRGKDITLKSSYETISNLLQKGYTVFLPDLRGMGELAKDDLINHFSNDTDFNFYSIRIGQSYLGRIVYDAWMLQKSLQKLYPKAEFSVVGDSFSKLNPTHIRLDRLLIDDGLEELHIAESVGPIAALFLSALEPSIKNVFLQGQLSSYESILQDFYFYHPFSIFVNGFANKLDLPEVCLALRNKNVILCNMVNGKNQLITKGSKELSKYLKVQKFLEKEPSSQSNFQIINGDIKEALLSLFQ